MAGDQIEIKEHIACGMSIYWYFGQMSILTFEPILTPRSTPGDLNSGKGAKIEIKGCTVDGYLFTDD